MTNPAYDRALIAQMLLKPGQYTKEAILTQVQLLTDADNEDAAGVHTARLPMHEDTELLNWLALHPKGAEIVIDGKATPCVFWGISSDPSNTLREAIQAARAGESQTGPLRSKSKL